MAIWRPPRMTGMAGFAASNPIVSGQWTRSACPESVAIENGDPARVQPTATSPGWPTSTGPESRLSR
jgi:hypothetical protein